MAPGENSDSLACQAVKGEAWNSSWLWLVLRAKMGSVIYIYIFIAEAED